MTCNGFFQFCGFEPQKWHTTFMNYPLTPHERLEFCPIAIPSRKSEKRVAGIQGASGDRAKQVLNSQLGVQVERKILYETSGGVRDLWVEVTSQGVTLHGYCRSYYAKQKAQHAAMAMLRAPFQLTNSIEVT